MLHQVAADHCRNDDENSDDRKHDRSVPYSVQLRAVRDSPWAVVLHPKSFPGGIRAAIASPPSTTVINQRFITRRLPPQFTAWVAPCSRVIVDTPVPLLAVPFELPSPVTLNRQE